MSATATSPTPNVGTKASSNYWILSLDGGGVRYVMQLVLLRRLHERLPWLLDRFNLVAGVSAGALIGTSLLSEGIESAYDRYVHESTVRQIFHSSWSRSLYSIHGLYAAQYTHAALKRLLDETIGETTTLQQVADMASRRSRRQVDALITAFCVDPPPPLRDETTEEGTHGPLDVVPGAWRPQIYHTLTTPPVQGWPCVRDMLLQSTAAPTYFPIYQGCVDGGMMANNPALLAVSLAVQHQRVSSLHQIRLLSLGSGAHADNMYGKSDDLGAVQWVSRIVNVMFDANSEATSLTCSALLGTTDRFARVQLSLPQAVSLSDYHQVPHLVELAEAYNLDAVVQQLETWHAVD